MINEIHPPKDPGIWRHALTMYMHSVDFRLYRRQSFCGMYVGGCREIDGDLPSRERGIPAILLFLLVGHGARSYVLNEMKCCVRTTMGAAIHVAQRANDTIYMLSLIHI